MNSIVAFTTRSRTFAFASRRSMRLSKRDSVRLASVQALEWPSLHGLAGLTTVATVSGEQVAYVALAAALTSFVIIFGIIPRFKSSFKEDDQWSGIYAQLMDMGSVTSVSPSVAVSLSESG
jgi:hypothetical protein